MKRPRALYLVAAWCCFALVMQASALTRPLRQYFAAGESPPMLLGFLPLLGLGFAIWQTVGLVRLRRFHRWFAVVFFAWWTVMLVWNGSIVFRSPKLKLLPAVILFSILFLFNLLSVWYLSRRSFREFAVQFVTEYDKEKHSRMMQKVFSKEDS